MIFFTCPDCGERICVDDKAEGSATVCVECGRVVEVPEDEEARRRLKRKRLGVKHLPDEAPDALVHAAVAMSCLSLFCAPLPAPTLALCVYGVAKYARNTYWLWVCMAPAFAFTICWMVVVFVVVFGQMK